jgi:hypothetical protein
MFHVRAGRNSPSIVCSRYLKSNCKSQQLGNPVSSIACLFSLFEAQFPVAAVECSNPINYFLFRCLESNCQFQELGVSVCAGTYRQKFQKTLSQFSLCVPVALPQTIAW